MSAFVDDSRKGVSNQTQITYKSRLKDKHNLFLDKIAMHRMCKSAFFVGEN
ncbi:MAG: hypothetical protein QM493_10395 [Sulfurovum sp.]